MIRFTLSSEDRQRLGAPDVLEYDETKLKLSEARRLQKATGLGPQELADGLKGFNLEAVAALVWLALLRAGIEVAFEDLDFDLSAFEEVPADSEPVGKDPSTPSPTST